MNPQALAKNAIRWIDTLPSYKQAEFGQRSRLGNHSLGFCCLGAGCYELGIGYMVSSGGEIDFSESVGLMGVEGFFGHGNFLFGQDSLTRLNDKTHAGFKRIANLLKTKPHWMFNPEVAELIAQHYGGEV